MCCSIKPNNGKINSKRIREGCLSSCYRTGLTIGNSVDRRIEGWISEDEKRTIDFDPKAAIKIRNAIP